MFPVSTHKTCWLFKDDQELNMLRANANKNFVERFSHKLQTIDPSKRSRFFLTAEEEKYLLRYYELHIINFCREFTPVMPKDVLGTSLHYMKRFYLNNSVMDFHPKEILVTCIFLACKVEEFSVSIKQFVSNVKGDREKAEKIILYNELLLMDKLNYQLVVHNVYKPIEGFLVDIQARGNTTHIERLRSDIDEIISKLYLTDACLQYSPSQLALAAILHAASKNQQNLDSYVTEKLLGTEGSAYLADLISIIRKIRTVATIVMENPDMLPNKETVKSLGKKLDKCRNEENNPNSEVYKKKVLQQMWDYDE